MTSLKFLFVDDEAQFIETIARRLRQRGFAVDCVFSGADAPERLEKDESVDVVFLDVKIQSLT